MRTVSARALASVVLVVVVVACGATSDLVGSGRGPSVGGPASSVGLEPVGGPARGPSAEDPGRGTDPYRGFGTWIDIYDSDVWEHPQHAVRSMAAHGVRTIYLQTSNYNRHSPYVHPEGVEAIVDAAHRHRLAVVAWYLPGFRDLHLDVHRALRSIRFETGAGNRFDSFALDIESPEVRRPRVRTARLLSLSERLRRAAGERYPLGAIVASPHRMVRTDPGFWPGFPWRRLAETYDVFLPMTYYTYRVRGPRAAAWYTAQNVQILRRQTSGLKVPIHVVGGISFDATGPETLGFVRTVQRKNVLGASYYTFPGIRLDQWEALRALR